MKKIMIMILAMVIAYGSVNTSHAISTGWKNATELGIGGGTVTTDAITSANDEKWYKFTTTSENEMCSVTLSNMPESGAYNVELRYQQSDEERPMYIVQNTMNINRTTGKSIIRLTLENIGTYYLRVYSVTGDYSSEAYQLTVNVYGGGYGVGVTQVLGNGQKYDWAACAEMLGKYYYKCVFGTGLTSRNYLNAASFVQSSGETDVSSSATRERRNLEDTLTATDYVFGGDYMQSSLFKITDELKTPLDFQKYIMFSDRNRYAMPAIIKVEQDEDCAEKNARYLLVSGYDADEEALKVKDPDIDGDVYLVYNGASLVYEDDYTYYNKAIVVK